MFVCGLSKQSEAKGMIRIMNDLIAEIRKKQDEMIIMINATFDEIIRKVGNLNLDNNIEKNEYEVSYPLTNVGGFKGEKVIAVIINGERYIVPTWKIAVKTILDEVLKDNRMKSKMNFLCDKLLGRVRNRLAHTSDGMRSAIKLDENLYMETHYDTETLMRFLLQILNEINYDYSKIQVVLKM